MTASPEISATLTLLDAQEDNAPRWLLGTDTTYTLGRVANTDITLPYSWVSRKHAMIQKEENGRFNLIDLGSSNGTFINGRKIHTPVSLQDGDCIGIGSTRLLFHQDTSPNRAAATNGPDLDEMTVAFVQKQIITILICDIHDYTKLSETMGDQWVSQLLQHWTGRVTKLVNKHNGTVDKFIGDAVMALWSGANLQDNIHQALKTAIAINTFTSNLGKKIPDLPWALQIGAALNTGEAMMGNLTQNGSYTVVGDVVNVAFRLESLTNRQEDLDIVMGCDAAMHLLAPETFFKKYSFRVKGKQEEVEAYGCSFPQLSTYLEHKLNQPGTG
ncbi:adenylate/guanylate cyclase domain-containing protein [Thiovibrio frasassiensis]|uniref:Adenylate/guanylate cyclase domain-containing protein n=1 Tax=Thiovibrio frasassiensis TaxID=2984131 RepID=A0A9X4RMT4_9BACT|nr:adenylate/guanylate cyclase domain-containing protein [Thiovibrio frasassiensis]MDG4476528.1 adenylate/guanylate cyclase domain-containing protein [Thiovibrio frasassiensis]